MSHWTGRFDLASLLKPRHQHPATYGPGRSFGHGTYLNLRTPLGRSFRTLQATGHQQGRSFRQAEKTATIRPGSEFIWGIPVQ